MKDIVIIVGAVYGSSLALIRAIKEKVACRAYVLCNNKKAARIIAYSKYVDEVHTINSSNELTYVKELKDWYKDKSFQTKPILYFTYDTACYYTDNYRNWFESKFVLCLPSSEIIQTFTQKGIAEISAAQAGLTVPKTQIIDNEDSIKHVAVTFNFPVIIKPRATYKKGSIDFKIKVFDAVPDFIKTSSQIISEGNSLICQEFIPGGNDSAWYYLFYRDRSGYIFNSMGKKTLQSSTNGGIMLKGKSEYNKEISNICHLFLDSIDYYGLGGIEFKYHNGKYYFIEMSTRIEGFYQITENSNIPLSLISYYDLSGKNLSSNTYKDNCQVESIEYYDSLNLLSFNLKARNIKHLITNTYQAFFNKKVFLNIYDKNDIKPFRKLLFELIKNKINL